MRVNRGFSLRVAKDQVVEGGGVNISISTSSSMIGSNARRRATSISAVR
jgi:hypothetical protein